MKPESSFLFATWSFLSLYATAGLCTAETLLQQGAPSPGLVQRQAQQERRAQFNPSQPRYQAPAPAQDKAHSPFSLESPSQLPQPDLQHPSSSQSPARHRSAASRRANTGTCTFTVSQVQRCTPDSTDSPAELVNYLQINTLYTPDSTVAVDLLHQRPIAEYNSYQRLLEHKAWDVASLKDDSRTLTITEGEEGDLRMSYGGAE
ncbi:hypothetical protein BU23DRAFT_549498 [Bimuria novae-zelandiae CBS 107.79]|uniref:Uncharacterized protein n=1 Tax=Bimuria novae-zelandiae CBS 107.79 TaxID=1447943 RepID=A0A6A5W073_9PLEO|nr:hypothetical protein BU23DRAFT_549498 [Bimuria novae-zelandiae CBS 107.79]